jgi:HSP20 family protein
MFGIVRKPSQTTPTSQLSQLSEWDPFRMMESLLRNEPWGDGFGLRRNDSALLARFDVKETKDSYLFKADLPGVKESDLEISLTGNRLTISGKREGEEQKEGENYYVMERTYGTFTRTFTLPEGADIDKVKAALKDGVLNLTIPKRAESQPRRVVVAKS